MVIQNHTKLQRLTGLQDNYSAAVDTVNGVKGRLDTLARLDVLHGQIGRVQVNAERLTVYVGLSVRATDAGSVAIRRNTELRAAEDYEQEAQDELAAAWDDAGGVCPMCEQPLERGVKA